MHRRLTGRHSRSWDGAASLCPRVVVGVFPGYVAAEVFRAGWGVMLPKNSCENASGMARRAHVNGYHRVCRATS